MHLERVRAAPHEPFTRPRAGRERDRGRAGSPARSARRTWWSTRVRRRLASTTTATWSAHVLRVDGEGIERSVHRIGAYVGAGSVAPVLRPFAVRGSRRRLLRNAVVARRPPRSDLLPRGTRHERLRVRAQGRRPAPGRVARALRRRRARRAFGELAAHGAGARRPVRIRDLARPRHRPTSRTPTAARCCASSQPLLDAGVAVVPAAARRHPDATRPRAAPGRARHVAARAQLAATPRSRCARPSTSARTRRRTSRSSARDCRPRST